MNTAADKPKSGLAVQIPAIGHVDDRGRFHTTIGFEKNWVAARDLPLSSILIPLASNLMHLARWSNTEAAKKDMATLVEFLARCTATDPNAKEGDSK